MERAHAVVFCDARLKSYEEDLIKDVYTRTALGDAELAWDRGNDHVQFGQVTAPLSAGAILGRRLSQIRTAAASERNARCDAVVSSADALAVEKRRLCDLCRNYSVAQRWNEKQATAIDLVPHTETLVQRKEYNGALDVLVPGPLGIRVHVDRFPQDILWQEEVDEALGEWEIVTGGKRVRYS